MPRILSYRFLARALPGLLLAGALAACGSTGSAAPTAAPQPTTAPTAVPEPTLAPTAEPTPTTEPTAEPTAEPTPTTEPTAEPTSVVFTSASDIPVQIEHPSDWEVSDFGDREVEDYVGLPEQSMAILSPEEKVGLVIRYYDYKGPGSGDVTGAYVAIQFNEDIDRTTVSETTDDNGNMDAEWTYADSATGEPMHALLRFIHNEGSDYTYALLFYAPEDRFEEVAPIGQAMIESFEEQ